MLRTILIFLAGLAFAGHATAQIIPSAGGSVRGQVLDGTTGEPVATASIAVLSATDSSLVAGALTTADGAFRVAGLPAGDYYLRISHIAFAPLARAGLNISQRAPAADVGSLSLARAVIAIDAVTATATRSDVQMSAERNTYLMRNMPATTGGNVSDVLRNVPAVEVDVDGKVSLRGNDNVAIQINGRAAPARGEQAGKLLQQLPASIVEKVEVMPNPSAKYDPDGIGGVINIVMKQNAELGLSGGLNLAAGTGARYNASGNLGYQKGAFTLFGTYAFMDETRGTQGTSARENFYPEATSRFIDQRSENTAVSNANTLNTTAELKLAENVVLGSTLLLSRRGYEMGSAGARRARDAAGALVNSWQDDLLNMSSDDVLDATLSLRLPVVSLEARYNRLAADMKQNTVTTSGSASESLTQLVQSVNDDLVLSADAARSIGDVRIESGVKFSRRGVENNLEGERGDNWFVTTEAVQAGYGVATREAGAWLVQGGLRVERTNRSYQGTADAPVTFTNLFPSALVAYKIGEDAQLKASYSRRTRRPEAFMLNSAMVYDDALNRQRGNPALLPEYTNAFEAGYQQTTSWGSVMVNPFLRQTAGALRMIRSTQGDTTTGVFTNFDDARSYGVDVNATLRGDGMSTMFGVNAFRHETDGGTVYGSGLGWSARASGNLSLGKATDVQASAQYRAPMQVHQGTLGAFASANFSIRHKLNGDKAVITLRVADPFDMMKSSRTINSMADELTYVMKSDRSFGARGVTLGVSYNFGTAPKLRAPRKQENEGGWEGN